MKLIHCVRLLAGCSEVSVIDEDILADYRPIVMVLKVEPQVIKVSENYPVLVKAFCHVDIRPQGMGL